MTEPDPTGVESPKPAARPGKWTCLFLRSRDPKTQALTTDAHDVEDVLQDSFLSMWRNRDRFDPTKGEAGAWAWVIVRNRAIDLLRRRRPAAPADLASIDDRRAERPEHALLAEEERRALTDALERVARPDVRRALHLRLVAGPPYAYASAATGVPVGTVASCVNRLRRTLRSDAARAA